MEDITTKGRTGATICTLEEMCFPVEIIDNPNKTNQEYSKIVTGIITEKTPFFNEVEMKLMHDNLDSNDVIDMLIEYPDTVEDVDIDLNYCSPRYELVPNDTIFPKVEEILNEQGIEFTVVYTHTNHARFYANYTIEDPRFSYKMEGTNDEIKFIWNFQHSYNGLTKYKGVAGFFRLVCENGLTVPVEEMKEFNLVLQGKHTKSILNSLKQFKEKLIYVAENLDTVKSAITDRYEILGNRWITGDDKIVDRITEVLEANKIAIIDNSNFNTLNYITQRIEFESTKVGLGYNGKVNDWLIYNSINRYIHDDSRNIASPEKRRETDSKILEYMLTYQ